MSSHRIDEPPMDKKTFPPGALLFEQGAVSSQIYLLLKGVVSITVDGNVVRTIEKRGSFVGEMNPLFGRPSATSATAVTECECGVIPIHYLEKILDKNPEDEIGLLGIFASHLLKKTGALPLEDLEIEEADFGDGMPSQGRTPSGGDREEQITRIILLVTKKETHGDNLRIHFKPMGFDVVVITDPREMIERMDQIRADLIIFNAADFPRLWKPGVKLLREKWTQEETVFILITGEDFEFEEAAKAAHLDVNGIVPENLLDKEVLFQLTDLVRRYKNFEDHRKFSRIVPRRVEVFRLLFTHPIHNYLVSGSVSDISLDGTSFIPEDPTLVSDLKVDQKIPSCSLRAGEHLITVHCRVARRGKDLGLEFESFEKDGHQRLFKYLMDRPERDMQAHIRRFRKDEALSRQRGGRPES